MITEITARGAGRTTLEITPRVKQKSLVFRSVFGFIIFLTPHKRRIRATTKKTEKEKGTGEGRYTERIVDIWN
jgi:hypothetical protein